MVSPSTILTTTPSSGRGDAAAAETKAKTTTSGNNARRRRTRPPCHARQSGVNYSGHHVWIHPTRRGLAPLVLGSDRDDSRENRDVTRWAEASGRRGMVSAPHRLASEAGVAALRDGGNALDAAVAAVATIAVVYPHMNGIGGDSFWLIYDAAHHRLAGLNAAGRSAAGVDPDWYRSKFADSIAPRGGPA